MNDYNHVKDIENFYKKIRNEYFKRYFVGKSLDETIYSGFKKIIGDLIRLRCETEILLDSFYAIKKQDKQNNNDKIKIRYSIAILKIFCKNIDKMLEPVINEFY